MLAVNLIRISIKVFRYTQTHKKCYPFYKREADGFVMRLQNEVKAVQYEDIPAVADVTYPTIRKIERMLPAFGSSSNNDNENSKDKILTRIPQSDKSLQLLRPGGN